MAKGDFHRRGLGKPRKISKKIIPLRRNCRRCKKRRVMHHHFYCDKCHRAR